MDPQNTDFDINEQDIDDFVAWMTKEYAPAPPQEEEPSEALLQAARQVWEQQQQERAEAARFFRPLRLAAADGDNEQAPLEMKVRIAFPHQGTTLTFDGLIEFMQVGRGEQWRVLCRVATGELPALAGHRLRVHMGGEAILLGPFNDRGVARTDLPAGLQPGDLLGLELVPQEQ